MYQVRLQAMTEMPRFFVRFAGEADSVIAATMKSRSEKFLADELQMQLQESLERARNAFEETGESETLERPLPSAVRVGDCTAATTRGFDQDSAWVDGAGVGLSSGTISLATMLRMRNQHHARDDGASVALSYGSITPTTMLRMLEKQEHYEMMRQTRASRAEEENPGHAACMGAMAWLEGDLDNELCERRSKE